MANDNHDTTEADGQWRLKSGGQLMLADETDGGRLVRLADVVPWLMQKYRLSESAAVQRMCDEIERGCKGVEGFFLTQGNEYAKPLSPDAMWGYHTAESWKRHCQTLLANATRAYDERARLASRRELYPPPWTYQEPNPPEFPAPGLTATLKRLREHREELNSQRQWLSRLAILLSLAQELWGYGKTAEVQPLAAVPEMAVQAKTVPVLPPEELKTGEELVAYRAANKGAVWCDFQLAVLARWVNSLGGSGVEGAVEMAASALGMTRRRVNELLARGGIPDGGNLRGKKSAKATATPWDI
jgi:hypothetical protein